MNKEDKKNAYLYCKFRDEQFALYDEYAKRHGMLMKTAAGGKCTFLCKRRNDTDRDMQENFSIQADCEFNHQKSAVRQLCYCYRSAGKQAEQNCQNDRNRTGVL